MFQWSESIKITVTKLHNNVCLSDHVLSPPVPSETTDGYSWNFVPTSCHQIPPHLSCHQ